MESPRGDATRGGNKDAKAPPVLTEEVSLDVTPKGGKVEGTVKAATAKTALLGKAAPVAVRGSVYPQAPATESLIKLLPFGVNATAINVSHHKEKQMNTVTRRATQLTTGKGQKYPLYYFIPSLTKDLRYLIYHSTESGTIQIHRLDVTTGESVQLTKGDTGQKGWWGSQGGIGVLDHRSVLNVARGHRLVYLKRYDESGKGQHEFADLTGEWRNSAGGQRGHFHPLLTPDRKWVLFAADEVDAGPKPAGTQIFLLDVSDLAGTDLIGDAVRNNPKLIQTETSKRK